MITKDNCNVNYEADAISFINEYDKSAKISCDSHTGTLIEEIINNNFTCNEIECAIDALKLNKSPGIYSIPAEFIKACKHSLAETITIALNYIIQHREFPETWASGIRSAVFKNGQRCQVNNFRGITFLPIMEKIFEAAVYRRLSFVNEAFEEIDKYNGGFLHDSRTSDNLYVLNGLIEKQLLLGKSLLVYFVDFSKAFDVINRNILFYKLMNRGWKGRVIDTLRNLYNKSNFRVKRHGQLSPAIQNRTGVNQGGISSGLMFRKYIVPGRFGRILKQPTWNRHLRRNPCSSTMGWWSNPLFRYLWGDAKPFKWPREVQFKYSNGSQWNQHQNAVLW